jgi:hypothetical protein
VKAVCASKKVGVQAPKAKKVMDDVELWPIIS